MVDEGARTAAAPWGPSGLLSRHRVSYRGSMNGTVSRRVVQRKRAMVKSIFQFGRHIFSRTDGHIIQEQTKVFDRRVLQFIFTLDLKTESRLGDG